MLKARRLLVGFLHVVSYIALLPATSAATMLLPADFNTVVSEAQTIVHGRVVEVRSETTGGRRTIETLVTVAVMESFKGGAVRSVTFRMPGGQVGRYRRVMIGVPEFEQGDEAILFLQGRPPLLPTLFGLSQGVYRIVRTSDGEAVVTPPPLISHGVATERVVRGDHARRSLSMNDFAREMRTLLGPVR